MLQSESLVMLKIRSRQRWCKLLPIGVNCVDLILAEKEEDESKGDSMWR